MTGGKKDLFVSYFQLIHNRTDSGLLTGFEINSVRAHDTKAAMLEE